MSGAKPNHAAKQRIYEQFARVSKAMSGERSVDALAKLAELSVANTSQHLQVLAAARLVETRRDGQRILYRLADTSVETLLHALRTTAESQLAELDEVARAYLVGRDEFEPISRTELRRRLRAGTVTLIDVRPAEEFDLGHIAGAVSVPVEEVTTWARAVPKGRTVVAYCRGPYCVYALQAVAALRKRGITAVRAEDGVSEWRAAGLPTEAGGGGVS